MAGCRLEPHPVFEGTFKKGRPSLADFALTPTLIDCTAAMLKIKPFLTSQWTNVGVIQECYVLHLC